MLEIVKRVADFQAQIEGFKLLSNDEIRLDLGMHNLKKVLLNILYPFYAEFHNKNVIVEIQISDDVAEENKMKIDYKIFNVAMHHFFNNIVKYTKPNSMVNIRFDSLTNNLTFEMLSVRIEQEEMEKIFELGISGANVGNLGGDGVGMFMVKKSLQFLGCEINIISNYLTTIYLDDVPYTENKFLVKFQSYKSY